MSVFQRGDFLLPREEFLPVWPVIACDQFTSQPEYWQKTAALVGDAPSAYHIIFPEAQLGGDEQGRIEAINSAMTDYLNTGVFKSYPDCYVYVERSLCDGSVRRGLVGVVDLECYDYHDKTAAPIRATEKTVVSRIPPRVRIRSGAPIETSHVLLLCADKKDRLLGSVEKGELLYDLELMQGGGRLRGWLVSGTPADRFDRELDAYVSQAPDGFAFAVGDGNHSLASAKACWEKLKEQDPTLIGSSHPARYAMVELENLFDESQRFEAIHRIVSGVDCKALLSQLEKEAAGEGKSVEWICGTRCGTLRFDADMLPVAALQKALDAWLGEYGGEVDYIHGAEVAAALAQQENTIAFLLPAIEKDSLFSGIIHGGVLPRKTFSMGHAVEKRYYLECRKIR